MPKILYPIQFKVKPSVFDEIAARKIKQITPGKTFGVYGGNFLPKNPYTHVHIVRGYSPKAPQIVYRISERKEGGECLVLGEVYKTFGL